MSDVCCCGVVGRNTEKMCYKEDCTVGDHAKEKLTLATPDVLSPSERYVFMAAPGDYRVFTEPFVPAELLEPLYERLETEDRTIKSYESLFGLLLGGHDPTEAADVTSPSVSSPDGRIGVALRTPSKKQKIFAEGQWHDTFSDEIDNEPSVGDLAKNADLSEMEIERLERVLGPRPNDAPPRAVLSQIHSIQKQVDELCDGQLSSEERSALTDLASTIQALEPEQGYPKSVLGFKKHLVHTVERRLYGRYIKPLEDAQAAGKASGPNQRAYVMSSSWRGIEQRCLRLERELSKLQSATQARPGALGPALGPNPPSAGDVGACTVTVNNQIITVLPRPVN